MSQHWEQRARTFAAEALGIVSAGIQKGETSEQILPQLDVLVDSFAEEGVPPAQPLLKVDEEQRLVWGWASVTTERGQPVVDHQGDIIPTDVLRKAAHEFMEIRAGKAMHKGARVGTIVESVVFTQELQKALGIDLGCEGWFVCVKVHGDEAWAKVKDGTYRGFSIGGSGIRTEVTA